MSHSHSNTALGRKHRDLIFGIDSARSFTVDTVDGVTLTKYYLLIKIVFYVPREFLKRRQCIMDLPCLAGEMSIMSCNVPFSYYVQPNIKEDEMLVNL